MIPPVMENYRYDGEREIARRIQNDAATADWHVLHSLDIGEHRSQVAGECDFVIVVPHSGVLCVEVKGCKSLKVEGGLWYYGTKIKGDKRGPFKQAADNMHSIRQYLVSKRPDLSRVMFWSAVIFPYITFSKSSPEWHDWQVIDARSYIAKPISQLFNSVLNQARIFLSESPTALWYDKDSYEFSDNHRDEITNILRPEFEFYETPTARRQSLLQQLTQYTTEQFVALDSMQSNPRVLFNGPAGTGKTLLAIEAARRSISKGDKTLLICFNKFIAKWIKAQFSEPDFNNLTISTLHSLMLAICKMNAPAESDSKFWTQTLPEQAISVILESNEKEVEKFVVMIVDEAQDILRPDYLDFLDLSLSGGLAAGTWDMFGDFTYQQIYSSATIKMEDFLLDRCANTPVYTLGINCRNTPRVAAYAALLGGLSPDYSKILRADDNVKPELVFFKNEQQQKEMLTEFLQHFREKEKFKGTEIVILSPLATNCCASSLPIPWKDKLRPFSLDSDSGHIRYSTIHSFKGLEAPVVIVTDLERIKNVESINLLYIAVTRALSRLVLLLHESARTDLRKILGVE